MQEGFEKQRLAFAGGAPDYAQRCRSLKVLRQGIRDRIEWMARAVSEDFGGRAREETLLYEAFPLLAQLRFAERHLRGWMRAQRVPSAWYLRPSRAYYEYQPLGVVGIIGTWNFPFLLTLSPLIDALAAGNHALLLLPSPAAPASARLMTELIAECFQPECVACVTGEVSTFSSLPFDHLLLTGSAMSGRAVMQRASENLTPVTLELGGKSPALIHASYPLRRAAERILAAKSINAGQTCLAPDYVLISEGQEQAFEAEARRAVRSFYPRFEGNPDYSNIVDERRYRRLCGLLDDAVTKGARVVELAGRTGRKLPPSLVFDVTPDMLLLQQEIFGPILPVICYRDLDEALAFINQRSAPLALYYFDGDPARVREVIRRSKSGGVTVNDCLLHFGQSHLPFGGVGASGMGRYHGFDGFVTFSHKRAVMVQGRFAATALLRAPFDGWRRALIRALLRVPR